MGVCAWITVFFSWSVATKLCVSPFWLTLVCPLASVEATAHNFLLISRLWSREITFHFSSVDEVV